MKFELKSHIGKIRLNNEDYIKGEILSENNEKIGIFIIADGMGGYQKGEIASSIAVETAFEFLKEKLTNNINFEKENIEELMILAFDNSNQRIYMKSKDNDEYDGMGTTMTILILFQEYAIIGNVGDSRCYSYSKDDGINKITKDNSLVQEMLDKGLINEVEAIDHPKKNIITRAVGTNEKVKVDIYKTKIQKNYKYLLSTDGVTNLINDFELEQILKSNTDLNNICDQIINLANSRGGSDNISLIVIEI